MCHLSAPSLRSCQLNRFASPVERAEVMTQQSRSHLIRERVDAPLSRRRLRVVIETLLAPLDGPCPAPFAAINVGFIARRAASARSGTSVPAEPTGSVSREFGRDVGSDTKMRSPGTPCRSRIWATPARRWYSRRQPK